MKREITVLKGPGVTQEVYDEMQRIVKANGGSLTPEAVLDNAKSERSPIHSFFTWDDSEAAEKCRLMEASQLIRTIKSVIITDGVSKPQTVRAFCSVQPVPSDDDEDDSASRRVYVPVMVAMEDKSYQEQTLAAALNELAAFRRKYSNLRQLSAVFAAVDALQERLKL